MAALTDERCVLTDVGSTKEQVAAFAAAQGLTHRFVPGHPMAGTDRAGLTAALAGPAHRRGLGALPGAAGPATAAFRWLAELLVERLRGAGGADVGHGARLGVPRSPHTCRTCSPARWPGPCSAHRCATRCSRSPPAASPTAPGSPATPADRTANMLLGNRDRVLRELAEVTAFLDDLTAALRADDAAGAHRAVRRGAGLPRRRCATGGSTRTTGSSRPVVTTPQRCPGCRELGVAGGHLTGLHVDADTVSYAARRARG